MRSHTRLAATVVVILTLAATQLRAQAAQSRGATAPHRLLVLAHPDPVSREVAAAIRNQLAADRRYEVVAERRLTQAERPVDLTADSTLTQQRALALVLKAEGFISVDASRVAEKSSILAIRSISDSDIIDAVTVPSGGSSAEVARTLVDRLLPNGWPSRSR